MTKVLLDTDIGTDIDDAVCLAYLLAHPDCDLLGIMTVTGQGHQRAMLASALCQAAGRDVPIFVGTEAPLLVRQRQPEVPQARALAGLTHAVDFPRVIEGIEFMRHAVRASPGEVVLLTIGPLTNIALLFALDPELPGLLKAMVTMAGSFSGGASDDREWNVLCDPHAAAMVYRCPTSSHRSIGVNVTRQVTMGSAEVRERFRAPRLRPVLDLAEVWFEQREVVTFHDPLAAATLFDDSICTFEDGTVTVIADAGQDHKPGATRWSPGSTDAPHQVATAVDPAAFFDQYFSVTG